MTEQRPAPRAAVPPAVDRHATVRLDDGLEVFCLRKAEARVLDHHVRGYLANGIAVHEGDVVFDVGANIGLFAVRAAAVAGVQVFAFEPIPAICAVLQANATRHGDGRITALPYGVSDAPGRLQFSYFPNSPALSTAHPEDWRDGDFEQAVKGNIAASGEVMWFAKWVPGFLSGFIARHLQRGRQEVDCELRTVSQVMREHGLERVDLLKVDCEGAELAVLEGIDDAHWPTIGRVVAEVHDLDGRLDAVRALLRRHGLTELVEEKEAGFEGTRLVNVYASRPERT